MLSDSNKALQKEIKAMSKIFGENQKVLVSMKGMIDTLTSNIRTYSKTIKADQHYRRRYTKTVCRP